jgi:hypothetical protein
MLFGETVAVYCENHTEHADTLCGQNAEFWCVKAGGTYSDHWSWIGLERIVCPLPSFTLRTFLLTLYLPEPNFSLNAQLSP